jgi:hypothetical protein
MVPMEFFFMDRGTHLPFCDGLGVHTFLFCSEMMLFFVELIHFSFDDHA